MSQNNSPGATLQSEWIRLLNSCSICYSQGLYEQAWIVLLDLQSSLPEKCFKETEAKFEKISKNLKIIKKDAIASSFQKSLQSLRYIRWSADFLRDEILPLKREIHTSLEHEGWISKTNGYSGVDVNKELAEL